MNSDSRQRCSTREDECCCCSPSRPPRPVVQDRSRQESASCTLYLNWSASRPMGRTKRIVLIGTLSSCASLLACDVPSTGVSSDPSLASSRSSVSIVKTDLGPRHRYNESIDGPPRANSTPELNVAAQMRRDITFIRGAPGATSNRTDRSSPTVPAPSVLMTDAHAGWYIQTARGIEVDAASIGLAGPSGFGVKKWISVPNSWTDALLYAPTMLPHGGSCIEVTLVHWNGLYQNQPDHMFGVWDWCNHPNGPFQYTEDMNNSTWLANYSYEHTPYTTGWSTTEQAASIAIVADNPSGQDQSYDCWKAVLWNVRTSAWEQKYRSCGTTQIGHPTGWIMHESAHMQGYYTPGCPTLPSLFADELFTAAPNGSGVPLTPPTSGDGMTFPLLDGSCWANASYSLFNLPWNGWYGWQALTPNSTF
jgi:hypothetical protein